MTRTLYLNFVDFFSFHVNIIDIDFQNISFQAMVFVIFND